MSEGYEEAVAALEDAMAIEHHTELMEAALDRNIERARQLMTYHIGFTVNVYAQSEDGVSPAGHKSLPRHASK
ncbi:hypothetical protein D3C87_2081850 [compost metagenome]